VTDGKVDDALEMLQTVRDAGIQWPDQYFSTE